MSDDLIFYTNPMSRGRIVRWMLEEVGAPYETEVIGYGPEMKGADYRAINPMGKVPAIRHRGVVVTECAAICAYLADAFPEAGLAPPAAERGAYYRWLFFAAGPLEAAVTNRVLQVNVPDEKRGMVGYGSYDEVLDTLAKAIPDDGYIAGERFSAADLYVGSHVNWGLQFGSIEERAGFRAYAGRVTDRPAYRRANELDNALMPEQQGGKAD
jgi:glutathione S-transferase